MLERSRNPLAAYGVALAATAVTLLIRLMLKPVLGNAVPQMAFFPAVMIAAYFGGLGPGMLATVLSAVAANYFLAEQTRSFHVSNANDVAALILFVLVGAIISTLCESLHRVRHHMVAIERRRAEEAMRETEVRFRQLVENIHEVFWMSDAQTKRMLYVSPGYEEIFGRTCASVFEHPEARFESIHPDDRAKVVEQTEWGRDGVFADLEFRIVRPDGSIRWVRNRGFPIKDEHGQLSRVAGLLEDITNRKQVEGELRENEHRWRSLTETLPQLVWTAMPDGACDYFSAQWTQYTGVPASQLLGWQWMETLHPDDREPTRQFWTDSVAGRHEYDVEYRVRRSDGVYRWFKTRGVPIRNSEGGIFKWFGTCTDITDGILAAEELRLSKEAAESANRAKDEFLANVSHEIRTPMNAILGLTTLVLGTRLDDGQRQSLTTVKSAADNLLGIINDLLDFSKIEAGKLELNHGEFSLRAALGDTLRALAIRAHQKGLELASNVQPDVPDDLIGDAGRLRQVLLNIVGNAIKFTAKGEVVVEVRTAERKVQSDDNPQDSGTNPSSTLHSAFCTLHFSVRDTGIGIPREKHAAIFRAFEQEDSSTTRKYGGTGLGLTIASQLVALMGGNISLESEPGRGSTFSITARFGRSAKRGAMPGACRSADVLENLRVLIVDDNFTNRHILEEWLQNWRMRPAAVGDGAAAVSALCQAAETGSPYSVVLLDGRMPDTDGMTLAVQIRERSDVSSARIILLTSDDTAVNTARSHEMGISAQLVKPVQQSQLLETIRHVMSQTVADTLATAAGESPTESESAFPAPAVPLHILVAEDNEFNVTLLKQLFDRKGHRARIAGDGSEALALATTGTFDALLLDIHLPEMDGFAVAQAIREQERGSGKHLPIIAFTARSGKQDRERCLAAGMDDFLSKPVQAEELWAVIDRNVAAHSPRDDVAHLLDPQAIRRACGGDAVILAKIAQTFRASVPTQVARVRSALDAKDMTRLREAAHLLCGTLSAFSTVAGTVASKLEDQAAIGEVVPCIPLVERLESICSELVEKTGDLSIEKLTN